MNGLSQIFRKLSLPIKTGQTTSYGSGAGLADRCVLAGRKGIMSKITDFDLYQIEAYKTANMSLSDLGQLINGGLGIAGEAGEVADEIKKYAYQGHDLDKEKLKKELGDVLWYVALTASALSIPLSEIATGNIDKLRARYGEVFDQYKSVNRQL